MNNNILNLYLCGISNEIDRLRSLGCNDDHILKKIRNNFLKKLGHTNTKNCNKIIDFVLYRKELVLMDKVLVFYK